MITAIARNWWVMLVRGLAAIIFGVLAFVWPGITLFVLVIFYGAYALVDGVFAIVAAFSDNVGKERWWVLFLKGLLGIAAGIVTFLWPGITAFALVYVIAAVAIVTGVLEIAAAIRLRKEIEGEWLLALTGVASIIFGVLMAIWPATGALALVWLIGSYAIVFGVLMIALAFRLRSWSKTQESSVFHMPSTP